MSLNENKKLSAIIKIVNYPSKNDIINYFKKFLKKLAIEIEYNIKNKENEILIIIPNHEIAYKLLESFNKEISNNILYSNCECSLSFKSFPHSISLPKIQNKNKNKIFFPKEINTSHHYKKFNIVKKPLIYNSSSSVNIRSYAQRHWADIKDKAGVINSYEPYIEWHIREYKEKMSNKKKWMDQKGFNNNVGRASKNRGNFIKNYVRVTPSLPPLLYEFRKPQKNKWINQSGFNLY